MLVAIVSVLALATASALSGQSISTLIGTGKPGFDESSVNNPYGLIVGPDGGLYFGDIGNHAVRRLDLKTRQVTTVAETDIKEPYELRFDKGGNLYFVDMPNHVVRRIEKKSRKVTPVAGTGIAGFSGDGGPATQAQFRQPHSISLDPFGGLLICDIGNHRVRRVNLAKGTIDTFLGNGERKPTPDGPATGAPLNGPRAIDFDSAGNLYIALREGNAVYRVSRDGRTISRIAGTGQKGYTGDNGPALQATLNGPKGITVSRDGAMYLADTENHAIRKVDLKTGIITTVAGTGEKGDGPDGDPLKCRMNRPHGVFVDRNGVVYIGDSEAHRIRMLRTGKSR